MMVWYYPGMEEPPTEKEIELMKKMDEKIVKFFKSVSHYIKVILVYGFYFVEVIAWKYLGEPVYRNIESLKIMDRFKAWVSTVEHRYALLGIFLSVFVLMEIMSTYGLILIGTGAFFTGIGLYVGKLFLTVPAVVVFKAGKKPLLSFWVVKTVYALIIKLKRSKIFRNIKKQMAEISEGAVRFKDEYLNGDGKVGFFESIKIIYKDIRGK